MTLATNSSVGTQHSFSIRLRSLISDGGGHPSCARERTAFLPVYACLYACIVPACLHSLPAYIQRLFAPFAQAHTFFLPYSHTLPSPTPLPLPTLPPHTLPFTTIVCSFVFYPRGWMGNLVLVVSQKGAALCGVVWGGRDSSVWCSQPLLNKKTGMGRQKAWRGAHAWACSTMPVVCGWFPCTCRSHTVFCCLLSSSHVVVVVDHFGTGWDGWPGGGGGGDLCPLPGSLHGLEGKMPLILGLCHVYSPFPIPLLYYYPIILPVVIIPLPIPPIPSLSLSLFHSITIPSMSVFLPVSSVV